MLRLPYVAQVPHIEVFKYIPYIYETHMQSINRFAEKYLYTLYKYSISKTELIRRKYLYTI